MARKSESDLAARVTAEAAIMASKLVAEAAETAKHLAASAAATAASLLPQVAIVAADLSKHEAVCLERYTGIEKALRLIMKLIGWATGAILLGMAGCIGYLMTHNGLTH